MRKCLFLNFNTTKHPFFEKLLELIKINQEKGNEIYLMKCNKNLNKFCCSFRRMQKYNPKKNYCTLCKKLFDKSCQLLNIPDNNIYTLKNFPDLKLPDFNTIEEIKNFSVNGWNIGFGVASTAMSYTRDHMFNPKENKKLISGLMKNAYTTAKNLDTVINDLNPDEVYIFNGRYAEYYGAVEVCRKTNTDFYVYESGADYTKYLLIKNNIPHDKKLVQETIKQMWEDETISYQDKLKVIENWNYNKRNDVEKNWHSYTKKQAKGLLPENFDKTKENIVIFNTSMDESAVFDDYQSPIDKNDNNIIKTIVEHYLNDNTKHFYLRVHPHLQNIKNTQMCEIKNKLYGKYKNLTVIMPEETVDSYAIMENADKVLVFHSTMGVEAAYAGIPVILVGKPPYDNLNCTYNAGNYDEIYNLIDTNQLTPKPKENTYPYIYWMNSFGIKHKYYIANELFHGTIMGVDFRKIKLQKPFDYIKYAFF